MSSLPIFPSNESKLLGNTEHPWDEVHAKKYYDEEGNELLNTLTGMTIPIGMIIPFAGNTIPAGWLLCDGSAVSRTNYADLFAVIGTTYGAGDGSTTFNLPLLTDNRFIEGSNTPGTQHEAGLPNIQATLGNTTLSSSIPATNEAGETNPFYEEDLARYGINYTNNHLERIYFDASRATSIYGNSSTVQPKSLTLRPLIKYI